MVVKSCKGLTYPYPKNIKPAERLHEDLIMSSCAGIKGEYNGERHEGGFYKLVQREYEEK